MRIVGRFILILVGLAAIAAALAYIFRGPVTAMGLRAVLENAGFENARLKVESVSLDKIAITNLSAGANSSSPDFKIERVDATYDWRRVLSDRQLDGLIIGPGVVRGSLTSQSGLNVAGREIGGGDAEAKALSLPASVIVVNDLRLALSGDEGSVDGLLDGSFDETSGAKFVFQSHAENFRYGSIGLKNLNADGGVQLLQNGDIALSTELIGNIDTSRGSIEQLDIIVEGGGGSWRDALNGGVSTLNGVMNIDIRSSGFDIANAPVLSVLSTDAEGSLLDVPIRSLAVSGQATFGLEDGAFWAKTDTGQAISIQSDRGDVLTLSGNDAGVILERTAAGMELGAMASLTGPSVTGSASVTAQSTGDGRWKFTVESGFLDPTIGDLSLGATSFEAKGSLNGNVVASDIIIATLIKKAEVGRFKVSKAPFSAALRLDADLDAKRLSVDTVDADCLGVERASMLLVGQDLNASVRNAKLCQTNGSLLTASWNGKPEARVIGRLSATRGNYHLGETTMAGLPPWIDFTAIYQLTEHRTNMEGRLGNGRVVLNDALIGTGANGTFTASLIDDALTIDSSLESIRIAQAKETEQVAPVMASGTGRLANNIFNFDYEVATPDGKPVGEGEGRHEVMTGKGEAVFRSGNLQFVRGGLQPSGLVPAIKGVIGATSGAGAVDARFEWSKPPAPIRSSAALNFQGLTFRGPGVAVSETRDVTGDLILSNLTPATSAGPQTINVGAVDLAALVLENGVVTFELPGDETLRVIKAEFPWFGGAIGAYDSVADISGGGATTRLEASNVDLSLLLDYLEIEGLSGEGVVEGVLPLVIEGGRARIEGGKMTAVGPGVVRYTGKATDAASGANQQAKLAFDILRNLKFSKLSAEIDGPLDGELKFNLLFEGTNEIPLDDPRVDDVIQSPVIYRISIDAPLLTLINNARNSVDPKFLLERAVDIRSGNPEIKGEPISVVEGDPVEPQN